MKKHLKPYILLVIFLVSACSPGVNTQEQRPTSTTTTHPTETALPPTPTEVYIPTPELPLPYITFSFVNQDIEEPLISRDPAAKGGDIYINPGAVLYHDGQFHLFVNSFKNWPSKTKIYYLTSSDGLIWQLQSPEPAILDVPYMKAGYDVGSVVVADDGTWMMYFHTLRTYNSSGTSIDYSSSGEIGRATAPSPLGPWTVDPKPLLTRGRAGEWDELGPDWPSVIKTQEGGFVMVYSVPVTKGGMRHFGLAFSDNGITWEKYNDPETQDAPYKYSDSILVPQGNWDANSLDRPELAATEDGYVLVYSGKSLHRRGIAFSSDLIHWETFSQPVMSKTQYPFSAENWDNALIYFDGILYYFMELGSVQYGTDIFLTQAELP